MQRAAGQVITDVTSSDSTEEGLSTQNRVLRKIAFGCSIPELMIETAREMESHSSKCSVAIHLVERLTGRLEGGVSPSLPTDLVRAIESIRIADDWPVAVDAIDFVGIADQVDAVGRGHGLLRCHTLPALSSRGTLVAILSIFSCEKLAGDSKCDSANEAFSSLLGMGIERLRHIDRFRLAQAAVDLIHQPAVCIGEDSRVLYANEAVCRALGFTRVELVAKKANDLDIDAEGSSLRRLWEDSARFGHAQMETELKRKDGSLIPVRISTSYVRVGQDAYHCAVIGDTSELKKLEGKLRECEARFALTEERLRQDALRDDLTGLPNRSLFMEHLKRSLERSRRSAKIYGFGVLFLDFDQFKRINDSLGHMVGDELLIAMARRLVLCVRPGDTVARLGGDEFAVLLANVVEVTEAVRVADRIHQTFREPFQLHGLEISITTSIGIAMGSETYKRPEDVLHDADTAMYRAKAAGRARHEVFDDAMHRRALEQLRLEAELRRALSGDEFLLLYQPIVSLPTRAPVGVEVFARWRHPTKGLLTPYHFLYAAEASGLIIDLGWWVFTEACRQIVAWSKGRHLTLHVNVSDKQLFQPDLVGRVEEVLKETGLSPGRLVLDIPENVVMQKADSSVTILAQLKSLGLRIHLDDFGTGYSSLGYLHRFQIDVLKIDRSFVRHLRSGGDNWIAVRTIVSLAQNLGMDVIAEGVETEEQLDELLELGCAHGQGSLFCDPLPSDELRSILD
ncbi:MAG TPA: EAL domain-containing protein [Vicinamibacteria bacterium]|nr:EAL domain-containing protein [Vicinamibacteria bacterium]